MFTGIVEEIGKINKIIKGEKSAKIIINADKVLEDVKFGDSIAVNGVCLTVTDYSSNNFTADVMTETFIKTNLKNLKPNDSVNLERALRLKDRLGGHIVSGHVDGIGTIKSIQRDEIAVWFEIKAPFEILKYIVYKGSVTIDGISLTVAFVDDFTFKVSIIPHTLQSTVLFYKKTGDEVNIECDILSKYVEKMLNFNSKKGLDMDFLRDNGFLI
ncbi:riboflavin synthase alpha chain [Caloramator quimbayensis]|uniref:Riboflavin synthase n=1 Tax=Caloramator quimbayensis TaxID=1147123 RepID=A0A1T4WM81_9CLOT|nr:riboflavin synthase [Caloramator quimbayensis]SKA78443.1 riboflavin synthase alpha chain [Caloramator quimbayensis]